MGRGLSGACLVVVVVWTCGVGWVGVVCGVNVGDREKDLIGRSLLYLIWLWYLRVDLGSDLKSAGFVLWYKSIRSHSG